jgi:hypothetical protein
LFPDSLLEKWKLLWEVANQGENQYAKQARDLSREHCRQRDRIDALEDENTDLKKQRAELIEVIMKYEDQLQGMVTC